MKFPKAIRFLPWFCTALALIPATMMAYLGYFSRMTYDDYCHIRLGQELGVWESTIHEFKHLVVRIRHLYSILLFVFGAWATGNLARFGQLRSGS